MWRAPSARPTWSQWRSHTSCQCPRTSRPTSPCTAIDSRFSVLLPRFGGTRGVTVMRPGFGVMNSGSTRTLSFSLSLSLSLSRVAAEMGHCSRTTSPCTAPRIRGHAGIQSAALGVWGLHSASSRTHRLVGTCQGWCCYCIRGIRSVGGSRPSHLAQHERAQCSQAGGMEEPPDPMTPGRARRKWSLLGREKVPLPCCLAPPLFSPPPVPPFPSN